jgi:hypothetical protein
MAAREYWFTRRRHHSAERFSQQPLHLLDARGRDQIVESIDFGINHLKRVLANVILLTLHYGLACYGSLIKLIAVHAATIVFLKFAIVLLRERPSKACRSGIVSLSAISNIDLGSHSRGDKESH